MMTGGVAKNPGVVKAVEEKLGSKLFICKEPEIVGALGAALFGLDKQRQIVGTMDVVDDFNRALQKCRNLNKKQVCTAEPNFAQDSSVSHEYYKK